MSGVQIVKQGAVYKLVFLCISDFHEVSEAVLTIACVCLYLILACVFKGGAETHNKLLTTVIEKRLMFIFQ